MLSRLKRLPQTCGGLRGWRRVLVAATAGAFAAASQSPVSMPVLMFICWPVIFWILAGTQGARAAATTGLAAGSGFFVVSLSWLVEPFLVDAARDGWMAPFALVFTAGGMALFWAAPFAIWRALRHNKNGGFVALAAWMALAEFARGHILTGFPWALTAYGWSESPVFQVVSLTGPYGLGFLTLVAAGLLARLKPVSILAAVALLGAGWSFGMQRLSQPAPVREDGFTVRIVQPNAAQRLKWRPDMMPVFYQRQLALSGMDGRRDVVVWPETAVPFFLEDRPDLRAQMVNAAKAPVIVGARQIVERRDGTDWYNALSVLDREGSIAATYRKSHLVPFGEYIPYGSLLRHIGIEAIAARASGGFSSGPGPQLIDAGDIPVFLPLICYEAIFPDGARTPEGRPDWLLQITNDAWFGTYSGPYQHLAQARSRAIEQGLPMARAANTGISAMIDPFGRITRSLGLGVEGKIDAALPAPLAPPPYARLGDLPFIFLIAVLALLPPAIRRCFRQNNSPT